MIKTIELLIIIVALNFGQLNAQNKLTADTTIIKISNSSVSAIEETEDDYDWGDTELENLKKENAKLDKEIAEKSIEIIGQIRQIFLLDRKVTDEERKNAINCIVSVNLRQHLLKNEIDYTEKMKKHNENVAFLKKELNITEQEIQEEIKKLKK